MMTHEKEEYLGVPTTLLNNLVSCIEGFKNSFNLVLYYNITFTFPILKILLIFVKL